MARLSPPLQQYRCFSSVACLPLRRPCRDPPTAALRHGHSCPLLAILQLNCRPARTLPCRLCHDRSHFGASSRAGPLPPAAPAGCRFPGGAATDHAAPGQSAPAAAAALGVTAPERQWAPLPPLLACPQLVWLSLVVTSCAALRFAAFVQRSSPSFRCPALPAGEPFAASLAGSDLSSCPAGGTWPPRPVQPCKPTPRSVTPLSPSRYMLKSLFPPGSSGPVACFPRRATRRHQSM